MAETMYWNCSHKKQNPRPCDKCSMNEQDCYILVRKLYMDCAEHDSHWTYKHLPDVLEQYNDRFERFDDEVKQAIGKKIFEDQKLIRALEKEIDEFNDHKAEYWHDFLYEQAREHGELEEPEKESK